MLFPEDKHIRVLRNPSGALASPVVAKLHHLVAEFLHPIQLMAERAVLLSIQIRPQLARRLLLVLLAMTVVLAWSVAHGRNDNKCHLLRSRQKIIHLIDNTVGMTAHQPWPLASVVQAIMPTRNNQGLRWHYSPSSTMLSSKGSEKSFFPPRWDRKGQGAPAEQHQNSCGQNLHGVLLERGFAV